MKNKIKKLINATLSQAKRSCKDRKKEQTTRFFQITA